MYGEGVRGIDEEPGFRVVKKHVVLETSDDEPITECNVKEWEVRYSGINFLTALKCLFCVVSNLTDMDYGQSMTVI